MYDELQKTAEDTKEEFSNTNSQKTKASKQAEMGNKRQIVGLDVQNMQRVISNDEDAWDPTVIS